ncbi:hypothetical protein E2C01_045898 [Portunus trituberculatus]|uniref:Uncharacterized protein n=1 Tax=Portunus trituberculatus TaxID=210409 RepID=A0A5B7G4C6_PORTR|nr:hypothetical protein [Portunus trituberculatus]
MRWVRRDWMCNRMQVDKSCVIGSEVSQWQKSSGGVGIYKRAPA